MSENKKKIKDSKKESKEDSKKDYQEKLKIDASFDDVLGMTFTESTIKEIK